MEKTFSFLVKEEILKTERSKQEFGLLFNAIIISNGYWKENALHVKILDKELRDKLSENIFKLLGVSNVLKGRDLIITSKDFIQDINIDFSLSLLKNLEEHRIFLTGIFFGKGYVNRPDSKNYHMDFRIKRHHDAFLIMELLKTLEIDSKHYIKNGWHYVYIKRHYYISELLKIFGTVTSAGVFDTVKIEKDFMSALNQRTAIDISNQIKIAEASNKQCKACKKVLNRFFKYNLNVKHKIIAELRLKNPEMSLSDLAYEYTIEAIDSDAFEAQISRQTVSRWLLQIIKESKRSV